MRGVVMYAEGDVRVEEIPDARIELSTDAVLRVTATCICGSDLWPYRGIEKVSGPTHMGHEYIGTVEQVGSDVRGLEVGDYVVGSFVASDNTCEVCRAGYQSGCIHRVFMGTVGAQSELVRVPWADGTLVKTPEKPADSLVPSLLAASDVLGTGWYAAVAAGASPGRTIAIVGDGAVGLCAIIAAKQLGAERIIAFSRHQDRQKLALEFGATDIVPQRGDAGAERIKELSHGYGAHGVVEAVGTQESMWQAIRSVRAGGQVGYVGVGHEVELNGMDLFMAGIHLEGGPAPVRRFLPHLLDLIWSGTINPGRVFDLTIPLEDAADGYRAMHERQATKVLLTV